MSGKRKTSFVLKSIPHFQLSVYDTPKNTHPVNMKPISIDHLSIFLDLHLLSCNLSLKNNEQNLSKKPLFQKKSPVSTELSTMTYMSFIMTPSSFLKNYGVIYCKILQFSSFSQFSPSEIQHFKKSTKEKSTWSYPHA